MTNMLKTLASESLEEGKNKCCLWMSEWVLLRRRFSWEFYPLEDIGDEVLLVVMTKAGVRCSWQL